MKSKNLLKSLMAISLMFAITVLMSSCGKDDEPQAPTIKIQVNGVDGFTVDIAAEASADVVKWHWDYGDGTTSDSVGGHYHTYEKGGDYTIKCTVTNADNVSATAETNVHVTTIADLLTAKPWVMANTGNNNGLGLTITEDLVLTYPVPDILGTINAFIGDDDIQYDYTKQYSNIFTFNSDGSYTINDGAVSDVMSPWVYTHTYWDDLNVIGSCAYVGIYAIKIDGLQGAKWQLHEGEDLTLHTVKDNSQTGGGNDYELQDVTFENANYLTFENGFLAFKDFSNTVLIRSIDENKMEVSIFLHMFLNGDQTVGIEQPSAFVNLTFIHPGDE